jgi:hypothetical protein
MCTNINMNSTAGVRDFGRFAPEFINTFKSLAGRQGFEFDLADWRTRSLHAQHAFAAIAM